MTFGGVSPPLGESPDFTWIALPYNAVPNRRRTIVDSRDFPRDKSLATVGKNRYRVKEMGDLEGYLDKLS